MNLRSYLSHLIYKAIGTTDFVRRVEWQIVFDWLDLKGEQKVLDVACGTGILSLKVAEKGGEVHGIDISSDSIEAARRLAVREKRACQFQVGNAEAIPYPDDYFDTIICNCSLEHFQNNVQALNEMNRVLKPEGLMVLTVDSFSYPGIKDRDRSRHQEMFAVVNYYTREELEDKLNDTGFEVIDSKYYLNSFASHLIYTWSMRLNWQGYGHLMLSIIGYPVCRISDRLFGSDKWGYGLAIKERKR